MLTDDRSTLVTEPATRSPEPTQAAPAASPLIALVGVPVALAFGVGTAALLERGPGTPAGFAVAIAAGLALARFVSPRARAEYVGVAAWGAIVALVTIWVLDLSDTRKHVLIRSLGMLAVALVLMVAGWLVSQSRRGTTPADAVRLAARVFTQPLRPAAAALLGAGMALPLIGTYAPMISESDSAWVAVSTQRVREDGVDLLQRNQDVFLPHLTLGTLIDLDGYRAAILFALATTVVLVALAAYLGQRLTGHAAGAIAAAAALLSMPEVGARADRLPMYAACFALGYGAGYLLHRAMSDGGARRWWQPVLAGIGLVLAYEAHSVGQLFLLVPFLLLILHPWARARGPFLVALGTILVASIPRVVMNLSLGGLSGFRSNYSDFMIQKGYLTTVNRDFWHQNLDTSPIGYLTNLPRMVEGAVGGRSILLLTVPALLAAVRAGRRARIFVAATAGLFVAALVIASPATYQRYVMPLALGFALIGAVGIVTAWRSGGDARLAGRVMLVVVLAAAFFQVNTVVHAALLRHDAIENGPWPQLSARIDDDRSIIGVRSHELVWTDPSRRTEFTRTMSEDDFVTYLSWPSDAEVTELFDRLGAGWALVNASMTIEIDYHQTWLAPTYGLDVRHVTALEASPDFCLVTVIGGYRLYRYGDCRPGDLVTLPPVPALDAVTGQPAELDEGVTGAAEPGGDATDPAADGTGEDTAEQSPDDDAVLCPDGSTPVAPAAPTDADGTDVDQGDGTQDPATAGVPEECPQDAEPVPSAGTP